MEAHDTWHTSWRAWQDITGIQPMSYVIFLYCSASHHNSCARFSCCPRLVLSVSVSAAPPAAQLVTRPPLTLRFTAQISGIDRRDRSRSDTLPGATDSAAPAAPLRSLGGRLDASAVCQRGSVTCSH